MCERGNVVLFGKELRFEMLNRGLQFIVLGAPLLNHMTGRSISIELLDNALYEHLWSLDDWVDMGRKYRTPQGS